MKTQPRYAGTFASLTLALISLLSVASPAQVKQAVAQRDRPSSCEHVTIVVDEAIERAEKLNDVHAPLIVIFQLGNKEKDRSLNASRMKLVEYSITRRRALSTFVLATSPQPVKGLGRADIYVGGRLTYALFFAKNSKTCEANKW